MSDTTGKSTSYINPKGAPAAKTILLLGDLLRTKFIVEIYLGDVVQFSEVCDILGFTGTYRGQEVSVMGSGMGIPSISLYSWELIHVFGCKKLVRIDSHSTPQSGLDLYDMVIGQTVSTNSSFLSQYNLPGVLTPSASLRPTEGVHDHAREQGIVTRVDNILSSDVFYNFQGDVNNRQVRMGMLVVEMESAGLYAIAAEVGMKAMRVFTVSDNIVADGKTTPEGREKTFTMMVELVLPLARL